MKERDIVIVKEGAVRLKEEDIKIVEGFSNGQGAKEISHDLKMNIRTLEARMFKLRIAFHCESITQLACEFLRKGLIK
jgi:DNA-binding NarL/FixJ family response regulator